MIKKWLGAIKNGELEACSLKDEDLYEWLASWNAPHLSTYICNDDKFRDCELHEEASLLILYIHSQFAHLSQLSSTRLRRSQIPAPQAGDAAKDSANLLSKARGAQSANIPVGAPSEPFIPQRSESLPTVEVGQIYSPGPAADGRRRIRTTPVDRLPFQSQLAGNLASLPPMASVLPPTAPCSENFLSRPLHSAALPMRHEAVKNISTRLQSRDYSVHDIVSTEAFNDPTVPVRQAATSDRSLLPSAREIRTGESPLRSRVNTTQCANDSPSSRVETLAERRFGGSGSPFAHFSSPTAGLRSGVNNSSVSKYDNTGSFDKSKATLDSCYFRNLVETSSSAFGDRGETRRVQSIAEGVCPAIPSGLYCGQLADNLVKSDKSRCSSAFEGCNIDGSSESLSLGGKSRETTFSKIEAQNRPVVTGLNPICQASVSSLSAVVVTTAVVVTSTNLSKTVDSADAADAARLPHDRVIPAETLDSAAGDMWWAHPPPLSALPTEDQNSAFDGKFCSSDQIKPDKLAGGCTALVRETLHALSFVFSALLLFKRIPAGGGPSSATSSGNSGVASNLALLVRLMLLGEQELAAQSAGACFSEHGSNAFSASSYDSCMSCSARRRYGSDNKSVNEEGGTESNPFFLGTPEHSTAFAAKALWFCRPLLAALPVRLRRQLQRNPALRRLSPALCDWLRVQMDCFESGRVLRTWDGLDSFPDGLIRRSYFGRGRHISLERKSSSTSERGFEYFPPECENEDDEERFEEEQARRGEKGSIGANEGSAIESLWLRSGGYGGAVAVDENGDEVLGLGMNALLLPSRGEAGKSDIGYSNSAGDRIAQDIRAPAGVDGRSAVQALNDTLGGGGARIFPLPVLGAVETDISFALPFREETDSRHHFKTAAQARIYGNRETARDAFLKLLRDFRALRSILDPSARRSAYLALPPACAALLAGLQRCNFTWFAGFLTAQLLQVGVYSEAEAESGDAACLLPSLAAQPLKALQLAQRFSRPSSSAGTGPISGISQCTPSVSSSSHLNSKAISPTVSPSPIREREVRLSAASVVHARPASASSAPSIPSISAGEVSSLGGVWAKKNMVAVLAGGNSARIAASGPSSVRNLGSGFSTVGGASGDVNNFSASARSLVENSGASAGIVVPSVGGPHNESAKVGLGRGSKSVAKAGGRMPTVPLGGGRGTHFASVTKADGYQADESRRTLCDAAPAKSFSGASVAPSNTTTPILAGAPSRSVSLTEVSSFNSDGIGDGEEVGAGSLLFHGNQRFFFIFIAACDSFRLNSLLLRAFTSTLSERDESVAAAAERCAEGGDGAGVRNFTEEVLKLKVLAKFLGYLCFAPNWGITDGGFTAAPIALPSSLPSFESPRSPSLSTSTASAPSTSAPTQSSPRLSPAFSAALMDAVAESERAHSRPPLDVAQRLRTASAAGRLVVTLPWVVEFLRMLSLDPVSSRMDYYRSLLLDVRALYSSHSTAFLLPRAPTFPARSAKTGSTLSSSASLSPKVLVFDDDDDDNYSSNLSSSLAPNSQVPVRPSLKSPNTNAVLAPAHRSVRLCLSIAIENLFDELGLPLVIQSFVGVGGPFAIPKFNSAISRKSAPDVNSCIETGAVVPLELAVSPSGGEICNGVGGRPGCLDSWAYLVGERFMHHVAGPLDELRLLLQAAEAGSPVLSGAFVGASVKSPLVGCANSSGTANGIAMDLHSTGQRLNIRKMRPSAVLPFPLSSDSPKVSAARGHIGNRIGRYEDRRSLTESGNIDLSEEFGSIPGSILGVFSSSQMLGDGVPPCALGTQKSSQKTTLELGGNTSVNNREGELGCNAHRNANRNTFCVAMSAADEKRGGKRHSSGGADLFPLFGVQLRANDDENCNTVATPVAILEDAEATAACAALLDPIFQARLVASFFRSQAPSLRSVVEALVEPAVQNACTIAADCCSVGAVAEAEITYLTAQSKTRARHVSQADDVFTELGERPLTTTGSALNNCDLNMDQSISTDASIGGAVSAQGSVSISGEQRFRFSSLLNPVSVAAVEEAQRMRLELLFRNAGIALEMESFSSTSAVVERAMHKAARAAGLLAPHLLRTSLRPALILLLPPWLDAVRIYITLRLALLHGMRFLASALPLRLEHAVRQEVERRGLERESMRRAIIRAAEGSVKPSIKVQSLSSAVGPSAVATVPLSSTVHNESRTSSKYSFVEGNLRADLPHKKTKSERIIGNLLNSNSGTIFDLLRSLWMAAQELGIEAVHQSSYSYSPLNRQNYGVNFNTGNVDDAVDSDNAAQGCDKSIEEGLLDSRIVSLEVNLVKALRALCDALEVQIVSDHDSRGHARIDEHSAICSSCSVGEQDVMCRSGSLGAAKAKNLSPCGAFANNCPTNSKLYFVLLAAIARSFSALTAATTACSRRAQVSQRSADISDHECSILRGLADLWEKALSLNFFITLAVRINSSLRLSVLLAAVFDLLVRWDNGFSGCSSNGSVDSEEYVQKLERFPELGEKLCEFFHVVFSSFNLTSSHLSEFGTARSRSNNQQTRENKSECCCRNIFALSSGRPPLTVPLTPGDLRLVLYGSLLCSSLFSRSIFGLSEAETEIRKSLIPKPIVPATMPCSVVSPRISVRVRVGFLRRARVATAEFRSTSLPAIVSKQHGNSISPENIFGDRDFCDYARNGGNAKSIESLRGDCGHSMRSMLLRVANTYSQSTAAFILVKLSADLLRRKLISVLDLESLLLRFLSIGSCNYFNASSALSDQLKCFCAHLLLTSACDERPVFDRHCVRVHFQHRSRVFYGRKPWGIFNRGDFPLSLALTRLTSYLAHNFSD